MSIASAVARTRLLIRQFSSNSMATGKSPIDTLSSFSTCELSDALIKLGVPHGGHIPDVQAMNDQSSQATLCGPAYTIKMVWSGASDEKLVLHDRKHWVDTVPEGSVVVINAPSSTKNAVWGGLMTAGALNRGAIGAVISGRIRDLAEHISPPQPRTFPIFARGHSTLGQSPFTRVSALNVPITISPEFSNLQEGEPEFPAVVVNPGDYVIADADGVVCVPQGIWENVVEKARVGRDVDAKCLESIRNGEGVGMAFKKWRGK